MAQRILVDNLINEVRAQLDEANTTSVSDSTDILPALNRGQNYATDILARKYKEALLTSAIIPITAQTNEYPIPESAFEQRLLRVELLAGGSAVELAYLNYTEVAFYTQGTDYLSGLPTGYTVQGQEFHIYPKPAGNYSLRLWYLQDPLPLVTSQGRINLVNSGSNYIIVDEIGGDVSLESDNLNSFVSIIDGASGLRKGTLQVQAIANTKITFKTVPTRTTVLDIDIDTDLSALASGLSVELDDYICISSGTCVPFFKKPISNFMVQYAVAEITRKLGGENGIENEVLAKFEKQMERTWSARPNNLRVALTDRAWVQSRRNRRG